MIASLWQDLRYSFRMLAKSPATTAIALLTLALGIGANSTIFSWINSTLLNPIPGLAHASEVVAVTPGGTAETPDVFNYPDYLDLRNANRSFSGLTASAIYGLNLSATTVTGKPERVWGMVTSANYFDVLGVRPVVGRGFLPSEEQRPGGAPVVLISYRMWQIRFAGSPAAIGRTIELDQHPYTIIGVAPAVFQGNQTGLREELWIPVSMARYILLGKDVLHDRNARFLTVLGRLKPGVTPPQAREELSVLMGHIAEQFPDSHKAHKTIQVYPLWRAPYGANAYLYKLLPMLMAIAGIVLLLACANVANLVLVRSIGRRRELAVRVALGASRRRLVRQLLIESVVLAVGGGAIAVLLTFWTAGLLARFIPPTNLPIWLNATADATVLLITFLISVLTGIIFGILPAVRAPGLAPVAVLKEDTASASGGRHRARLSSALVVAQIALSLLLLVCAGLFIRSFQKAQAFNPGFNEDHVLLASYHLLSADYSEEQGIEFDRHLLANLRRLPGAQSVTLASWVPLGFMFNTTDVEPQGYVPQPHESMAIDYASVAPDYLRTLGIPLLAGREFTEEDSKTSRLVAVVNQAFADRYWPHQQVIGRRVETQDKYFSVVGIAGNSDYNDLNETPQPFMYVSLFQVYSPLGIIHARVAGSPLAVAGAVQKKVQELNADLPLFDVGTLKERVQVASFGERLAGTFVGAFGMVALLLAAVGIYGIIAYTMRQRTHEIGIRIALGARPGDVLALVLHHGVRLTAIGVMLGLAMSLAVTRFLRGLVFGVATSDAATFLFVVVLLSVVALAACYIPARRAMRIDPITALRYQ